MNRIILIVCVLILITCSDDQSPVVEITSPSDGAVVSGVVAINIEASDNRSLDIIDLYIDNSFIVSYDAEPDMSYGFLWETDSLPDASLHTIYAKAYDTAENEGISDTVTVTIDNSGTLEENKRGQTILTADCRF